MDFHILLKIWVKVLAKLSSKYNQKHFDGAKKSRAPNVATDVFKTTSKRAIQEIIETAD